ncbi:MAG: hypothetical protein IK093_03650 [Ruminiclostridium sp.]|nr:hypothetical protein [Ruminiclostridium sp.]
MAINYCDSIALEAASGDLGRVSDRTYDIVQDIKECVSRLSAQHYGPIDAITQELGEIVSALDDCSVNIGALSDTLGEISQVYLRAEESAFNAVTSSAVSPMGPVRYNEGSQSDVQTRVSPYMNRSLVYEEWLMSLAFENK